MWSLKSLLFFHCIAMSRSVAAQLIRAAGYEGREAKVSCPYTGGYESYQKYLCKGSCGYDDVLIHTEEARKHRYSIYDDRKQKSFTVTISGLKLMDAGLYWCGVTRSGKDIYTEVKLTVVPDRCCDSINHVQVYVKGSVSISCPYQSKYQYNSKYFCRGSRPSTCLEQAVISSEHNQDGHFSLIDDKVSGIVTVTISILSQEDAGMFLCGIHSNDSLDIFSAVKLEVKVNPTVAVPTVAVPTVAAETSSVTYVAPVVCLAVVIVTVAVLVYKWKCKKVEGAGGQYGNTRRTAKPEKVNENQEGVKPTKAGLFTHRSTLHSDEDADEDEDQPSYENLSAAEDIYCNQSAITCHNSDRY